MTFVSDLPASMQNHFLNLTNLGGDSPKLGFAPRLCHYFTSIAPSMSKFPYQESLDVTFKFLSHLDLLVFGMHHLLSSSQRLKFQMAGKRISTRF